MHSRVRLITALVLAAVLTAGTAAFAAEGSEFQQFVTGGDGGGVVTSVNAEASAVGIQVLDGGGNAIDAAVATVFAVGVTTPEMCGIGGGGFLVYRSADGTQVATLDFRESYPSGVLPAIYGPGMHQEHPTNPFAGFAGHLAVGVPGTVAGMDAALAQYGSGSLTWKEAITPAEELAREGVTVTPEFWLLSTFFRDRLKYYGGPRDTYLIGGEAPYPPGSTLVQKDYADSLALIAEQGPAAFYTGDIAEKIVLDMNGAQAAARTNPEIVKWWGSEPNDIGALTAEDLASYRAIWREPLVGNYRGHQVITMPPPTAGGVFALEMLNILEGFPLGTKGSVMKGDTRDFTQSQADHLHVLAEAQKIAWGDAVAVRGDPDFYDLPTKTLTSNGYAKERSAEIDLDKAKAYEPYPSPAGGSANTEGAPAHTSHVSVIDKQGNSVAVTCSLGLPFGSGVMAPGTGFVLNDSTVPPTAPGTPDDARPGKRAGSNLTPVIVVRHGRAVLVTGAAGGKKIPMAVLQGIVNVVDFKLDIAHAVDAERIDAVIADTSGPAAAPHQLWLEDGRVDDDVESELEARGHAISRQGEYGDSAIVETAGVDLESGQRRAANDPRFEGAPCGQGAPCEQRRFRDDPGL